MPDAWWDSIARVFAHALKAAMGMELSPEMVKQTICPGLIDPTGEALLASMDEAGVDKTLLLPLDFGLALGEPRISYEEQNWGFAELGVPVLAHTGQFNLYDKYNDPVYLDRVLVDFPDLPIIAAHMAEGWSDCLFAMAIYKPNLATDFSRWQRAVVENYRHFCERLREALDSFGSDRVLYGTDGPYLRLALPDKDYVQAVKDLPTRAPKGITFS